MSKLSELKDQILKDHRVNADEAYQVIELVMGGKITQRERKEMHDLLVTHGGQLEPKARKELEKALGLAGPKKLSREAAVRDNGELDVVGKTVKMVESEGPATLIELDVGGQKINAAFKNDLSPGLKKFVSNGKSSLTAKEAMTLAKGFSNGKFSDGDADALFRAGDRLEVTVHYPDGSTQDTQGLVVSSGESPLILVVNKSGHYQMIRQEPKSREQLVVRAFVAGAAN